MCCAKGESPSEADVARSLSALVGKASGRVVITTFASNVARLRAAAEAGLANGKQVMVIGRAMERVLAVARECGYLDGLPAFLGQDHFDRIPRSQVLALATGSQGEPRAALARIAEDEHPTATLAPGDIVVFSSRTIPGNEKAVGKIVNGLVAQGIEVVTDRTQLVHVSGHPRRAELAKMYAWLRPKIAIPAHGEAVHLSEHADFARAQGVSEVVRALNGDIVLLAAGQAGIVGQVDHGRLYKDGDILLPPGDDCIAQRRRLSFAGVVSIALALSPKGDLSGDPDVMIAGLPARTAPGARHGRGRRCRDFRDVREPAARQAPRRRRGFDRDRARRAQRGQRRLGQEARGACSRRRSLKERPYDRTPEPCRDRRERRRRGERPLSRSAWR